MFLSILSEVRERARARHKKGMDQDINIADDSLASTSAPALRFGRLSLCTSIGHACRYSFVLAQVRIDMQNLGC